MHSNDLYNAMIKGVSPPRLFLRDAGVHGAAIGAGTWCSPDPFGGEV